MANNNNKHSEYGSSSYSGADIKVIATLSHQFLTKWKAEMLKLREDEEKILKGMSTHQANLYSYESASTEQEDLSNQLISIMNQLSDLSAQITSLDISSGTPEVNALAVIALAELSAQLATLQVQLEAGQARHSELEEMSKRADAAREYLKKMENPLKELQKNIREKATLIMGSQVELGTVQTISCQSHRPKAAVRAIGSTYARGYTRGPRTIAGSMIFTVLNKQSLHHLCKAMGTMYGNQINDLNPSVILPDQLPPIDLTFIMANEYGSVSRMALYGVEFLNSGYTFSIEDLLLEEVVQFVARDLDPMTDIWDTSHRKSRDRTLHDAPITAKETLRGFLATRKRTRTRRNM
jgi:hypothetical protein